MEEMESRKIADEVKIAKKPGRPKSIKVVDEVVEIKSTVESIKTTVPEVKPIGDFRAKSAVPDSFMAKRFASRPKDPTYKGWIKLTPEEAEELGLAGKLLGHHPGLGIGLLAPEKGE